MNGGHPSTPPRCLQSSSRALQQWVKPPAPHVAALHMIGASGGQRAIPPWHAQQTAPSVSQLQLVPSKHSMTPNAVPVAPPSHGHEPSGKRSGGIGGSGGGSVGGGASMQHSAHWLLQPSLFVSDAARLHDSVSSPAQEKEEPSCRVHSREHDAGGGANGGASGGGGAGGGGGGTHALGGSARDDWPMRWPSVHKRGPPCAEQSSSQQWSTPSAQSARAWHGGQVASKRRSAPAAERSSKERGISGKRGSWGLRGRGCQWGAWGCGEGHVSGERGAAGKGMSVGPRSRNGRCDCECSRGRRWRRTLREIHRYLVART